MRGGGSLFQFSLVKVDPGMFDFNKSELNVIKLYTATARYRLFNHIVSHQKLQAQKDNFELILKFKITKCIFLPDLF